LGYESISQLINQLNLHIMAPRSRSSWGAEIWLFKMWTI